MKVCNLQQLKILTTLKDLFKFLKSILKMEDRKKLKRQNKNQGQICKVISLTQTRNPGIVFLEGIISENIMILKVYAFMSESNFGIVKVRISMDI